jgi:hypothetical protein
VVYIFLVVVVALVDTVDKYDLTMCCNTFTCWGVGDNFRTYPQNPTEIKVIHSYPQILAKVF